MQGNDLHCVQCGYDLRAIEANTQCSECGCGTILSRIYAGNEKLYRRESKILGKKDLLRRNRSGSIVLFLIQFIGALGFLITLQFLPTIMLPDVVLVVYINSIVFWGMLGYIFHTLFQHAESILKFREALRSDFFQSQIT